MISPIEPGDTVSVSYVGKVTTKNISGRLYITPNDDGTYPIPIGADVKLLKRANSAKDDAVGTIRLMKLNGLKYIKVSSDNWVQINTHLPYPNSGSVIARSNKVHG